jgi:hypothetical protein
MMPKVVINTRHGGFGLCHEACLRARELGLPVTLKGEMYSDGSGPAIGSGLDQWDIKRDDPRLVQIVEEMGSEAGGVFAELKIVEVPDDVKWEIGEYDGAEWVQEVHRTWS